MARRSDHTREELKEVILDTAWQLIEEKGKAALTARNIAAQVGYAPGTIYNIFKSMDDLCVHINCRTLDLLYQSLSEPEYDSSVKEDLKKMASAYASFAKKYRNHWLLLFSNEVLTRENAPIQYWEKVENIFLPLETLLLPFFDKRDEEYKKTTARTLWASVHGIYFLAETSNDSVISGTLDIPSMINCLIDNFVSGLKYDSSNTTT